MTSLNPEPPAAALLVGLLAGTPARLESARVLLEAEWGPVALAFGPRPWTESAYYDAEMGPGLLRQFLGFEKPVAVDRLAALKLRAIELEARLAAGAPVARPVNIDPGLVDANTLTLASTKRGGHRIWIGPGIWAEITLQFRNGAFQPLPWTYADYRRPETLEWLGVFRRSALNT